MEKDKTKAEKKTSTIKLKGIKCEQKNQNRMHIQLQRADSELLHRLRHRFRSQSYGFHILI